MSIKSRNYCVTFYNEPKHTLPSGFRYAIYGKEICPNTGRTHWQSYVELYNSQRPSYLKRAFEDNTIHLEIKRGTRLQARDYCKKDGDFNEFGVWIGGQGHRSDLDVIGEQLLSGESTLEDIMRETPTTYCQYRNGLRDLAAVGTKNKTKAFRNLEVILLTGPTGCGKTRQAMEEAEYRIQGTQLAWWQDYNGEKTICIDEYNNDVGITEMLNLLDGYQLRLNVKGSHTYANWNKVYITTNLKINELHVNAKESHRNALFRRITTIRSFWNDEVQG